MVFERYSDSAGVYVLLDSENSSVYKQLYRAAKAKLKLRIKAVVVTPAPSSSTLQKKQHDKSSAKKQQQQQHEKATTTTTTNTNTAGGGSGNAAPAAPPKKPATPHQWQHQQGNEPVRPQCNVHPPTSYHGVDTASSSVLHTSPATGAAFYVSCNSCSRSIPNEHYHCSICEDGDYDLCSECVHAGVSCLVEDHWLIKRSFKNGLVVNSVTEKVTPKMEKVASSSGSSGSSGSSTTDNKDEDINKTPVPPPQQPQVSISSDNSKTENHFEHDSTLPKDGATHGRFSTGPIRHRLHAAICDGCERVSSWSCMDAHNG